MQRIHHIIAAVLLLVVTLSTEASANGWDQHTYNKSKYVTLKNVKEFYRFSTMSVSGNKVTLENPAVKIQFAVNSHECIMNGVKFILSKPIALMNGKTLISQTDLIKLIDPVLRPNYIRDKALFKTVVIDPGHGGKDPGAVTKLGTEAGYNLKVALRVRSYLQQRGFNVVMTRSNDTFLSLTERVKLANRHKNAIFVSIHFNAGGAGKAKGLETFTLSPQGVAHHGRGVKASDNRVLRGNHQDSQNIALATAIHGSSMMRLKVADRGIKRARYSVLTSIQHPAILVEGGFMSNAEEGRKIHTSTYQDNLAKGITEGILKYKAALSRSAK